jgi:carboxyl-terminal processing protease
MMSERPVFRLVGLGCLGVILALANPVAAQSEPLTDAQRLNLESFDLAWQTISEKHWDPQLGGIDWPAIRDELRPRVQRGTSARTTRAIMRDMISRLGASHYQIIPAEMYARFEQGGGERDDVAEAWDTGCGFEVRIDDGRAVVAGVWSGSAADDVGVKAGWEIVGIDGYTPQKPWGHTTAVTSRLLGAAGDSVSIEFLDADGKAVTRTIKFGELRTRRYRFGDIPPLAVWIGYERVGGDIGYIRMNWFWDPMLVMKHFNDAMRSFRDTDGIVIDIRGNGGGIGTMGTAMAGWLVAERGKYFGVMRNRHCEMRELIHPRAETYAGPVAVLVDGGTGSAAEIFAAGLQDLGRARVFGSRTYGGVLPAGFLKLPNGDVLQYAQANYTSVGGYELEGRGVIPDVELSPTAPTPRREDDPVLQAAIAWIEEQR